MPIMQGLCSMLQLYHYAQNYAGIMHLTLNFSWVLQSCRKKSKTMDMQTLDGGGGRKQGALWSMWKWWIVSRYSYHFSLRSWSSRYSWLSFFTLKIIKEKVYLTYITSFGLRRKFLNFSVLLTKQNEEMPVRNEQALYSLKIGNVFKSRKRLLRNFIPVWLASH